MKGETTWYFPAAQLGRGPSKCGGPHKSEELARRRAQAIGRALARAGVIDFFVGLGRGWNRRYPADSAIVWAPEATLEIPPLPKLKPL